MSPIIVASWIAFSAIAGQAPAITFGPFVSSADLFATLENNSTIGFAYAGDKFVGSVYSGASNDQLYSTDLNGESVAKFGSPLPDFSGEIYVSSSLGVGGFGPNRDVYAGSQVDGVVYRIAHDGSAQAPFVVGLTGGVRSIAFDPYGRYGLDMIVATDSGDVYRVNGAGTPTLLVHLGEDTEGMGFAPQAFGSFAKGTLFVASEASGTIRAISSNGTITPVVTGLVGAETISFVPLNLGSSGNPIEGMYAASFPNDVQRALASEFTAYEGDAIVTGETGQEIWRVHASGGDFTADLLGYLPAQSEDSVFVTPDVINPPVPEPGLGGMLLAGLGGLGFASRRHQARNR